MSSMYNTGSVSQYQQEDAGKKAGTNSPASVLKANVSTTDKLGADWNVHQCNF